MNVAGFASVFDWQTGTYRVYRLPYTPLLMSDPSFCRPGVAPTAVGVDVTMALCPLPAGSQFVGMSKTAMGQVMRFPNQGYVGTGPAPGLGGVEPSGGLGQVLTEAVLAGVAVQVGVGLIAPHIIRFLRE